MTPKTSGCALEALAATVEALTGPDREVDALISAQLRIDAVPSWARTWAGEWRAGNDGTVTMMHNNGKPGPHFMARAWTASLDAAMTLVPEGWFGRVEPRFYSDDGEVRWRAYCIKPDWQKWTPYDDWFDVVGPDTADKAPLALCAAALRARARQATSAAIGGDPQPRDPSSYDKKPS